MCLFILYLNLKVIEKNHVFEQNYKIIKRKIAKVWKKKYI